MQTRTQQEVEKKKTGETGAEYYGRAGAGRGRHRSLGGVAISCQHPLVIFPGCVHHGNILILAVHERPRGGGGGVVNAMRDRRL